MINDLSHSITPVLVYDEEHIHQKYHSLLSLIKNDANILYPLKTCNIMAILKIIKPYTKGFSCSSLFEVMLAKDLGNKTGPLHLAMA